jgi:LmbE family N-acetylglucosaminyl deacetylase
VLWLCLLLAGIAPVLAHTEFPPPTRDDRIVIVAPHPDDEVLGAGGLIQQALAAGADVRVIYLTNGDHNQVAFKLVKLDLHLSGPEYLVFGEKRRKEAIAAAGQLGLPADHLTFLGYPDWGTLRIWRDYWDTPKPFRSDATRVETVPYQEAFNPGHPYRPQSIVEDFCVLFRQLKPTRILVTHPSDTNPDHRAASNFVRLAVLKLADEGQHPSIIYYIIHFGRWPRPYHYHPELELAPPRALLDDGTWMSLSLSTNQTERKHSAILENRTQTATRHYFLTAFARANEIFATQPVPQVPWLPANFAPDWRMAVRNKTIVCEMDEPPDPMNRHADPAPPTTISIEHTEFLRQGDSLIAALEFSNRLGTRSGVHLMLYGYESGRAFADLPKLHVNLTPFGGLRVYQGRTLVLQSGVSVQNVLNRSIIRIPMRLLGGPGVDYVFTATRAHLGEIAADDTAWELVSLAKAEVQKKP